MSDTPRLKCKTGGCDVLEELERELAEAKAEIVRLKRPVRCHDVDEFYREEAATGGEGEGE